MTRSNVLWAALSFAGLLLPLLAARAAPIPELKDEERLQKARVGGLYTTLLMQIKVARDRGDHGLFDDAGFRNVKEYAGHKDLPAGWWVYVHPYWYIWRDVTLAPRPKRSWGSEQATGKPDTNAAGDIQTAWASQTADGQPEWLMTEYAELVEPTAVLVHETYNPGALVRITAFKLDGTEVELWKGIDPTGPAAGKGMSEVPVKPGFKTNRIRIYLDSRNVAGWNEIDAVGIKDKTKKVHWAVSASASSEYAGPLPNQDVRALLAERRMRKLENEVRELRKRVAELEAMLKGAKKKKDE
jgi:hypothetical protein